MMQKFIWGFYSLLGKSSLNFEEIIKRYNPVITLKPFANTSYVHIKFKKPQVISALLRSKLLVLLLVAFILVILWRWPPVTVFENFLETKKVFQQKNYTTFIDSL